MKIRPLADKVLVERIEAQTTTAGGIVLPDTAKEKPQRGKIIGVGDGKVLDDGSRRKMQLK
ncbi:MAG: co-chaperone GroES, partial [Candidatus Brocadiia bacterium]